ncbi:MAG TPA: hypothetical protein VFD92_11730 [Candidatus Binatia bacterium]|nr:hypothetical protein [Candidatus Binatia bacterium]
MRRSRGGGTALAVAVLGTWAAVAVPRAVAEEVLYAHSVSTSRTLVDWRSYFSGDMRELTTRSESTTVYDRKDNPPVRVGGVDLDPTRASPIESTSSVRYVARASDPDFGTIRVESHARTATGDVIDVGYSFKEPQPRPPLAVGPIDGQEIAIPPREQRIGGRTLVFRATTRTVAIDAILVAPSFLELIAGGQVREVRDPGAHMAEGSLRVVSATGEAIGYYAGDIRTSHGTEWVAPR